MSRIVENISLSTNDSKNFANILKTLPLEQRAVTMAKHQEYKKAEAFLHEHEEKSSKHSSWARFAMSTTYWEHINDEPTKKPQEEIKAFLELIIDSKNEFPEESWKNARSTIEGLAGKLDKIDEQTQCHMKMMLKRIQ